MNRRHLLSSTLLLLPAALSPGCALIFSGAKPRGQRDFTRLKWVWLLCDIFVLGGGIAIGTVFVSIPLLAVIIDFATGAIWGYKQQGDDYSDFEDSIEGKNTPTDAVESIAAITTPVRRLALCSAAPIPVGPEDVALWQVDFADHLRQCSECQQALVAEGPTTQLLSPPDEAWGHLRRPIRVRLG